MRLFAVAVLASCALSAAGDEFTEQELERWAQHFEDVAQQGRDLWTSPELGTNGVACAQCHPNAANTHPETYPKFQKQLGRVAQMWEMVNWCIRNPLEGTDLAVDDPRMTALLAYAHKERRGVELDPGKH
ncbi:MAG: cytochrome C [Gammaproteobacteria bacterium]|nr:cytochrome C [Gammaproteobacteria bacterium]